MYDVAITTCKAILRNDPENFDTMLLLSKLYIEKRMYDKAIDELANANRFEAGNVEVLSLMYEVYSNLGKHKDAANICRHILTLSQDDGHIMLVLENARAKL